MPKSKFLNKTLFGSRSGSSGSSTQGQIQVQPLPTDSSQGGRNEAWTASGNGQDTRRRSSLLGAASSTMQGLSGGKVLPETGTGRERKKARPRSSLLGAASSAIQGLFGGGFMGRGSLARRQSDLTMDQSFDALALARQHGFDIVEVRSIAKQMANVQADPRFSADASLSMDVFYGFLCKVFEVDAVDKNFLETSYARFSTPGSFTLAYFLAWYKSHMFSHISPAKADQASWAAESLSYELAAKHQVCPVKIDRIRNIYDKIDLDGSGALDFAEFKVVMLELMKADEESIGELRLRAFWRELDTDGSGAAEFDEFVAWYVKYFKTETKDCGSVEAFYASHVPLPGLLGRSMAQSQSKTKQNR